VLHDELDVRGRHQRVVPARAEGGTHIAGGMRSEAARREGVSPA
jgi:hypothetical protein